MATNEREVHGLTDDGELSDRMAQWARLGITLLAALAAGALFISWRSGWVWLAAPVLFLAGGGFAEFVFRRLASPAEIREDLEDRVRNPPL